jgi:hypothetical protein
MDIRISESNRSPPQSVIAQKRNDSDEFGCSTRDVYSVDALSALQEWLQMTKNRDSAYYEGRLRRDFPRIFSDLRAGRFESVRQAAAFVGLIHLPTRVDALKREWKGATTREKNEFVAWTKARKAASPAPSTPIMDAAGHLKPDVIRFINEWTRDKRIKPGKIMKEIGFSNFDYTLSHALRLGAPIRSAVIAPLEVWLFRKGFKGS